MYSLCLSFIWRFLVSNMEYTYISRNHPLRVAYLLQNMLKNLVASPTSQAFLFFLFILSDPLLLNHAPTAAPTAGTRINLSCVSCVANYLKQCNASVKQ